MSLPWMSFYPGDYLADTMHLSTLEHGAYMLLIMHYWQNDGLPNDEKKLMRICRMTQEEWGESRGTLSDFFLGGWRHKRIDEELADAVEKHSKLSKAGQAGGKKSAETRRKNKQKASDASSPASTDAGSVGGIDASINASTDAYTNGSSGATDGASSEDSSNYNHHLSYPGYQSGEELDEVAPGEPEDGPFTGQETSSPIPISERALAAMRGRR